MGVRRRPPAIAWGVRLEQRTGWYFDATGCLRACLVINASVVGQVAVIDAETGEPVNVPVEDVLTEPPE